LYDTNLAVERIAAARQAIDSCNLPFVLVARTDCLNVGKPDGLGEAIERANRYREAGADCLFAPGASDLDTVKVLVREIQGPINVVMGLSGSDVTFQELKDAGVRRVSTGGSIARALYYQIREAAHEMTSTGTFSFAEKQIPQGELNKLFES
jgi:2-methylisocitrate lyase-like PEP mutase family enzyme